MSRPNRIPPIITGKKAVFEESCRCQLCETCNLISDTGTIDELTIDTLTAINSKITVNSDICFNGAVEFCVNDQPITAGDESLSLRLISHITVPNNTPTELSGGGAVWGTDSANHLYDDTGNFNLTTGRFTAPTGGGKYLISAHVAWRETTDNSGERIFQIKKNAAIVLRVDSQPVSDAIANTNQVGTVIVRLNEGDDVFIQVEARNLNGANVEIDGTMNATHISITRIANKDPA